MARGRIAALSSQGMLARIFAASGAEEGGLGANLGFCGRRCEHFRSSSVRKCVRPASYTDQTSGPRARGRATRSGAMPPHARQCVAAGCFTEGAAIRPALPAALLLA